VKLGDYVGPQTKLTSVDENKTLEAYINVPSEPLRRVRGSTAPLFDCPTHETHHPTASARFVRHRNEYHHRK